VGPFIVTLEPSGMIEAWDYTDSSRRLCMTWIKPEFEFVDLCSEVTSYLYHR
jgi:hypothetical protein